MSAPNGAGGGELNAEVPVLLSAAAHVDETNGAIGTQLGLVRGTVEQLAGRTWQGAAAQAFGRVMADWDGAVARLNGALAGIADQLRLNSAHYDAEESHNVSTIGRVSAQHGPLNI